MKLTALVFVTLDGVYQGPGGADEDRRGGFERGGWMAPFSDEETGQFISSAYEGMDAMLLGRVTFDIWATYWPLHHGDDPISHGINVLPKYVPSTNPQGPDVAEHPRHRPRRRSEDPRAQGAARAGPPAPGQRCAPAVAPGARPHRRAAARHPPGRARRRAAAVPGEGPDPPPRAARVEAHHQRCDAPDVSAGRARLIRRDGGLVRGEGRLAAHAVDLAAELLAVLEAELLDAPMHHDAARRASTAPGHAQLSPSTVVHDVRLPAAVHVSPYVAAGAIGRLAHSGCL